MKFLKRVLLGYEYIYYRLYVLNKYLWKVQLSNGNKEMAAFFATLGITYSFVALVFSMEMILDFFFNVPYIFNNIYLLIFLVGSVFFIHYFLFERNKKYLELEKKFSKKSENKFSWMVKGFFCFLYIFGSIICYLFLL